MTFDLTLPVTRESFDPSGIRIEVSDENGNDRTVAAFARTGAALGTVTWWEANSSVAHIAPEHPRHPVHRMLFDQAKQLCPTLWGPMPTMPTRRNPVEQIAAREVFVSSDDAGPAVLSAHYMTKNILDAPWNLPAPDLAALRAAWQRRGTGLYVVVSFSDESGTDVYTPLAWSTSENTLHLPDISYSGELGRHLDLVRQAAARPVSYLWD